MNKREILFRGKRLDNGEWAYAPAFLTLHNADKSESCTKLLDFRTDNKKAVEADTGEELFYLEGIIVDPATPDHEGGAE